MAENILSVQDLHTSFTTDHGEVMAVNGVTFNLEELPDWQDEASMEVIL